MAPTTTSPVLTPMRTRKSMAVRAREVLAERPQRRLDGQRRAQCAVRVILVGDGRAEESHHAVAQELVDRPVVAMDRAQDQGEGPVHDAVHLLGVEASPTSR